MKKYPLVILCHVSVSLDCYSATKVMRKTETTKGKAEKKYFVHPHNPQALMARQKDKKRLKEGRGAYYYKNNYYFCIPNYDKRRMFNNDEKE